MASVKQISLQHLVECPICMEDTDVPKQFPCRHTVCVGCISKLAIIQGKVTCPLCRAECTIPESGPSHLPTNLTIIQLKDIIGGVTNETRQQCEYCDERFATHFCKDCDVNICGDRVMIHENNKHFKDHKPIPISIVMCKSHKKLFTFFCLDCNMLLCRVCLHEGTCSHHKVQALGELQQSKMNDMEKLIDKLSENIQRNVDITQPARIQLETNLSSVENIQIQIKEQTEKIITILKQREGELLSETEKYEKEMLALKSEVDTNDNLDKLSQLKEAAEASLAAGIQQILLTLPFFIGALQSYSKVKTVNKNINKTIQFDKQDTLILGSVHNIMSIHGHGQQDTASKGAMRRLDSNPSKILSMASTSPPLREKDLTCKLLWEKANTGFVMTNVIFTTNFNIAVTQWETSVLLFDKHSNVLADSKDQNTNIKCNNGICFHTKENVLLVHHRLNQLVVLQPKSLNYKRKVKFDHISPYGMAMLSNGHIVITGVSDGIKKVGVIDVNGINVWTSYNKGYQFKDPAYITIDSMDNIIVSDRVNKKIIKLSQTGNIVCEWSTEGRPHGLAVFDDKLLVAEHGSPPETPDCVREYDVNGGYGRQVITWDRCDELFGHLMSVATYRNQLVALGYFGIRMYRLTHD